MSRPQRPDILVGLRARPCSLAILMVTGRKSSKNCLQHTGRPQGPRPPSIFASSRTPICLSSIRVLNT